MAFMVPPGDYLMSIEPRMRTARRCTLAETDPLLARLLAAATAGVTPAGPAQRRAPVRLVGTKAVCLVAAAPP